ncbi:hypothetical protein J4050_08625 [Winogradskyella sp. DF17]|uniref:GLPGLI family protein n=1 Tax=Winogradskyella pelagia TaxID=2819984 RepID=A0ABS3T2Y6_9FLAO|nr:hypothetical protein [Winogradskyella sp. DF17]MBO3116809.1 hypothetical protein [Winogradskyella sp. DF17]
MENVFKVIQRKGLILLALWFVSTVFGQKSNLYIWRYEGKPAIKLNDSISPVTNGAAITKKSKLIMGRDDVAYIINNSGEVFELHETGTFKHKELSKLEPRKARTSFEKKLTTYLWKEFTNSVKKGYNKSGVVYRGDYVELLQPLDSTSLYANEIVFEWKAKENKTKPYYFVLRELGTTETTMIGTYDTKIHLFTDDIRLKNGKSYEWTVVESKYENLDKVNFSTIKILNDSEYQTQKTEIDIFIDFLNSIGYSSEEISDVLCLKIRSCF